MIIYNIYIMKLSYCILISFQSLEHNQILNSLRDVLNNAMLPVNITTHNDYGRLLWDITQREDPSQLHYHKIKDMNKLKAYSSLCTCACHTLKHHNVIDPAFYWTLSARKVHVLCASPSSSSMSKCPSCVNQLQMSKKKKKSATAL